MSIFRILCISVILFSPCSMAVSFSYMWNLQNKTTPPLLEMSNIFGGYSKPIFLPNLSGSGILSFRRCSAYATVIPNRQRQVNVILVPKKTIVPGLGELFFDVSRLTGGWSASEYYDSWVLKKKIFDRPQYHVKDCPDIGWYYPQFSYDIGSMGLQVVIKNATSIGRYRGSIPIKVSLIEYFYDFTSEIMEFSNAELYNYGENRTINYDISVVGYCNAPSELNINHGSLSLDEANNHLVSKKILMSCSNDVSLNVVLRPGIPSNINYPNSDGIGVFMGNGWNSTILVNNKSTIPDGINIMSNQNIEVSSRLRKTNTSSEGKLAGSAILEVTLN